MRKKISLLIVGLALFLGAFLVYQYVMNASVGSGRQQTQQTIQVEDDGMLSLQGRDPKTGALLYDFTATKAVPIKGPDGKQLPGQYDVTNPVGRYYLRDGRVALLRADHGTLAVDMASKKKSEAFGGKLSGHVRMVLGPAEIPVEEDGPKPGQIEVRLDKDLEMSMNDSVLSSPGGVHVRSEDTAFAGSFDGENLTVAFNRKEQRIEYLRIDPTTGKDNEIVIHRVKQNGTSLLGEEEGNGKKDGAAAVLAAKPATTQDDSAPKANAYKLSFGQDVVARLGTSELSSDRLFVLFMTPAKDRTKDLLKGAETGGETGATSKPAVAAASEPAATTQKDTLDLRITWRGPMEMRPLDENDMTLVDEKDRALLAEGTKDRPVKVIDSTREITAAKLRYHKAEDRVELESDTYNDVCVKDPSMGIIKCAKLNYLLQADKADKLFLAGPGRLDVPQSALHKDRVEAGKGGAPMVVSWEKMMDVDLVSVAGGGGGGWGGGTTGKRAVKHALLTGDVWVRDPGLPGVSNAFEMNAATLDLQMAQATTVKMSQSLEHLTATAVKVKSARPGAALNDYPQGLTADRLDVSTAAGPDGKGGGLSPSKMLAAGNVVAWTYGNQSDLSENLTAARKPDKAASNKLVKQTIYTPVLEAMLEPKEKGGEKGAEAVALGSNTGVKSLTATDGVKVELEGIGAVVTAKSMVADPRTGRVRLLGDPGSMTPVLVTMGDDRIESFEMIFNQHANTLNQLHSIEIPREGAFTFVEKKEGEGAGGGVVEKATPVRITWTEKMTYDQWSRQARFMGNKVEIKTVGAAEETVEVSCKKLLEATLAERGASGGGGGGAKKPPIEQFKAQGEVEVTQTKWGKQGNILTRMYMQSEEARYSEASQRLELPHAGMIGLEDNEIKENKGSGKDAADTSGKTVLTWKDNLVFAMDTGVITITDSVHVIRVPTKPMQVATVSGGKNGGKGIMGGPVQRVDLYGPSLTAKLLPNKSSNESTPKGAAAFLGSGGRPSLESVKIAGPARLVAGEREVRAPKELAYDEVNHIAEAKGTRQEPVQFIAPGANFPETPGIKWNLITGETEIESARGMMKLE
ncbi:MAG: hypothetical protein FWD61_03115 [Phycisphaerales bacterium]|nr:hypothetical protein [Phycisphaerales bacterium]